MVSLAAAAVRSTSEAEIKSGVRAFGLKAAVRVVWNGDSLKIHDAQKKWFDEWSDTSVV